MQHSDIATSTESANSAKEFDGGRVRVVSYLGPAGTFTHDAARKLWHDDVILNPIATVPAVIESVLNEEADGGVIPVENTVEGVVSLSLDQLIFRTSRLLMQREVSVRITFNAYRAKDASGEPAVVASHPHGLAQCRRYVASTGLPTEHFPSTAAAVEAASLRPEIIAIGAANLEDRYSVDVLDHEVEDYSSAYTRFVHVGDKAKATSLPPAVPGSTWRTTFALTPVSTRPGILADVFTHFADEGINVSSLTSRPLPGSAGAYVFVATVDREDSVASLVRAASGLLLAGIRIKYLGRYLSDAQTTIPANRELIPPEGSFNHHDAHKLAELF